MQTLKQFYDSIVVKTAVDYIPLRGNWKILVSLISRKLNKLHWLLAHRVQQLNFVI